MLFNTIDFAIFLPLVFAAYWLLNKHLKIQNILLLLASFYFYACWDWRFLFLLIFSISLDYFTGLKMQNAANKKGKRFWFWLSISANLGFLGFFKYYNFFIDSFEQLLHQFGFEGHFWSLNIILPVGISFYTFHGLSYVVDIYKDRIEAEKEFITYAVFVSFFPLLVAGPIERATHLLPQLKRARSFDYSRAIDGLRQILWGLFKKVVIADQCAEYANLIFNGADDFTGSTLVLGALLFTFQIYGDFSGYSDIALGTARLFGVELLKNFNFPYFSRDIAEFWRRWHISLSTWFRDYLYFPLGGSKGSKWMQVRNTFIIFIVSGFWHGSNWTFIFWGFLNALYFIPLLLLNRNRNNLDIVAKGKYLPTLKEFISMAITFALTVIAWIFFRAASIEAAFDYLYHMVSSDLFTLPQFDQRGNALFCLVYVAFFMLIEWLGRENNYAIEGFGLKWHPALRWSFYYLILIMILFSFGKEEQFIYFQF